MYFQNKLANKFFSSVNIFALLIQLIAPIFSFAPVYAGSSTPTSNLSFNATTNTFTIGVDSTSKVDYGLYYRRSPGVTEAVTGSANNSSANFSRDIYAGTCSTGGTCVPHLVQRGILKTEVKSSQWLYAKVFTVDNGVLTIVKEGTDTILDLTAEETTWLENANSDTLSAIQLGSLDSQTSPPSSSTILGANTVTTATTTTTGNPSADLDQCANGGVGGPHIDCTGSAWQNGNLNGNQAHYREGDSVPYRLRFGNLPNGSHSVTIQWDTTKAGKHAIDYITTFNRTETTADPCSGVVGCTLGLYSAYPIPHDPNTVATQVSGEFRLFGGTITSLSGYSLSGTYAGDSSTSITINFTTTITNPVLSWGGHIGSQIDWGAGMSASGIAGSPYHTRLLNLDGSGGNQDRSLAAGAIPPTPTITTQVSTSSTYIGGSVTDTATLSGSGNNPPAVTGSVTFFLCGPDVSTNPDCTTGGTQQGTPVTIVTGQATSAPFVTSVNGNYCYRAEYTPDSTASYSPFFHTNLTTECFSVLQQSSITIIKDAQPNSTQTFGFTTTGTGLSAFTLDDDGNNADTFSNTKVFSGLTAGSYSVTESTTSGWTLDNANCGGANGVSTNGATITFNLAAGQNVACTYTNSQDTASITVNKVLSPVNDPGLFNLQIDGSTAGTGANVGNGGTTGTVTVLTTSAHTVSETAGTSTILSDYTSTYSCSNNVSGSGATIPAFSVTKGQNVICTFTNTRKTGAVQVSKLLDNDGNGTFETSNPSSFTWSLDGNGANLMGSTKTGINTGTHSVNENSVANYHFVGWYLTGDTQHSCANPTGNTLPASVSVADQATTQITLCNAVDTGTLTVIKHVINDNGGALTASNFSLHVKNGGTDVTGSPAAGSEIGTNYTLPVGSYVVSENSPPAGYAQTGLSGNCDPNGNITVSKNTTVTCTITNNDIPAHLIVIKHVVTDNGGTAVASDFTMSINGVTATGGNSFPGSESGTNKTLTTVGAYNVTESGPSGYAETKSADCTGTIALGETKTCTITNDDIQPKLTLTKIVVNDNGGNAQVSDFPLFVSGLKVTSGVQNGINAGSYTASETNLSGYTPGVWTGNCAADGTITLNVGDVKTCSITNNDQPAQITLIKSVTNNNGGVAGVNDFGLSIDGGAVLSGSTHDVNSNTPHILNETGLTGYSFVSITGDAKCPSVLGASVTLNEGEHITCTITNDDNAAHLVVIKHVINDNGGTAAAADFTTTISGVTTANPTTSGSESPGVNNTLTTVGSYSVDEGAHAGYTKSLSADCSGTIALGQTKTCTITNDDISPQLTVIKHVINDNGGTASAAAFTVNVTGTKVSNPTFPGSETGTTVSLDAGSYSADEAAFTGYAKTLSTDCVGTIAIGEHKTCTITNDDIQPKLTVTKVVIGGSAVVSDFPLFVDHTQVTSGVQNIFDAASYVVSETNQAGYTGVISGDCNPQGGVTLNPGDVKSCTITNTRDTGTVIVHKQVDTKGDGTFSGSDALANNLGFLWGLDSETATRSMGTSAINVETGPHGVTENSIPGYLYVGWFNNNSDSGFSCTRPESTGLPTFGVNKDQAREITLCNQLQNPILTITKSNNTNGDDRHPGDSVLFTLIITATQSAVNNVVVTDLPAGGFKYHSGSWTSNSTTRGDLKGLGITPEPTYHSPGTWQLGNMSAGEVVTLTYLTDIDSNEAAGRYPDLAWAQGTSLSSAQVLANADTGVFVGTDVNIIRDQQNTTSISIGQVLGASTLPSTGANTIFVILGILLLGLGVALSGLGLSLKKGNHGPFKFAFLTLLFAVFLSLTGFVGVKPAYAGNVSVRVEQPKTPTNLDTFPINFVTLDILGRPVTARCYKKSPSDGGFSQFGGDISVSSGGNTNNCPVDSGIMHDRGTYQFYVTAIAGPDSVTSNIFSVDFNNTVGPDTPTNYNRSATNSCINKITFRTANDSGRTVKVEIYRSTNTSFNIDSGSRVGTVNVGSNTDGVYNDTVPDCGQTYYYAIRAYDSAGNGSSVIGDSVIITKVAPSSVSGAIPVSGVSLSNGPAVLGEKTGTSAGEVKGEATGEGETAPETLSPASLLSKLGGKKGLFAILGVLVLAGIAYYVISRRKV